MPSPRKKRGEEPAENGKLKPIPILSKLTIVEKIGIGLLLISALLYSFSTCNAEEEEDDPAYAELSMAERRELEIRDSLYALVKDLPVLFAVFDSVKMRSGPGLNHPMIEYLSHGDTVYYLNEYTETVQTIRVAVEEVRTEPWVKIRTKTGNEGWTFGAGLSFYPRPKRDITQRASNIETDSTGSDSSARAIPPSDSAQRDTTVN